MAQSAEHPAYAFVTLLTTDTYLAGALTAVNSILDLESIDSVKTFETVCLVTPATVGHKSIQALQKVFDRVVGVEPIVTQSWEQLKLLGRPDLSKALSKLHVFRLTEYDKVVFFDADTLALRPLSSLFQLKESFAAAPDSGWPDSFNSGLMVLEPSEAGFQGLVGMMQERGSWDGGDQGLLNDYFQGKWHRLSYGYNVTPSAYYTYAPAFRRHGADVSLLHFIGTNKPWHRGTRDTYTPDAASSDYHGLVHQWFDVYERHFGTAHTNTVADKVLPPPVSFRSTFTSLAPIINLTKATPAPSPNEQGDGGASWNPATSNPPSGPSEWQMRQPITDHYENAWDDPNRAHHKQRFDAPDYYPTVPTSTHEWYAEVMKKRPDPNAVRPVFPWEGGYQAAHEAAPSPPPEPASRQFESRKDEPPTPAKVVLKNPTFVNAWDAIPAIDRYAKSLAKSTAPKKGAQGEAADESGSSSKKGKRDDLGGRQSSLAEPAVQPYERRSDASSRDGDDEEDTTSGRSGEDDEEAEDRVPIKFKGRTPSGVPISAELSPTNTRSSRGYSSSEERRTTSTSSSGSSGSGGDSTTTSPPKPPRRDSRFVPLSPRQSPSSPTKMHLRLPPQGLAVPQQVASPGATSPRLMAQAVRNSTAARLVASGAGSGGNAPPVVRATRVFSPETDTSRVKEEGLAALERFVQQMEGGGGQQQPQAGAQ